MRILRGMDDSERLTRLEERYAHLQRHVIEQDKAMLAFGDELARVKADLGRVRSQQHQQQASPVADGPAPVEERPPHY